jgi:hypothetical protein
MNEGRQTMDWLLPLRSEQAEPVRSPPRKMSARPKVGRTPDALSTPTIGRDSGFDLQPDSDGGPTPRKSRVQYFTYRDAVLHTRSGGIILHQKFVPPFTGERYALEPAAIDAIIMAAQQSPKVAEPIAVGYRAGWNNYYHWTTQSLFNIYFLQKSGVLENARLALPVLRPIQMRSLELLGIDLEAVLYVNRKAPIRAASLTTTSVLLLPAAEAAPAELRRMGSRIRSKAQARPSVHRAIYISRLDATRRKMLNEETLARRLEQLGVQPVQMSGKTLDEQISLIGGARLIIAPHGAALTNVLYSNSGTCVYELFPSSYQVACYEHLARAVGAAYCSDVFEAPPSDNNEAWKDIHWKVDIDRVSARAEHLLRKVGG